MPSSQPIHVEAVREPPLCDQPVEMVERKGIGHPDTICDSVCEQVSLALCRAYQRAFGRVLHHNVDKALLVAGQTQLRLGGGRVLEPMQLYLGDRASAGVGRRTLPLADIAQRAVERWFRRHLPHVDPRRHLQCTPLMKPGAPELAQIFGRRQAVLPANDTSVGTGFAPLTPTEDLVLGLERFLNGRTFKKRFPGTGQDVKVMAVRQEREVTLTVAMPLLATNVTSERGYFAAKARIVRAIEAWVRRRARPLRVGVTLNALDQEGRGLDGMYLTLLGTSAEHGDSGQVGRGNRACGLITFHRPMSLEATAGKNPTSHVGKIYNVLARQIAERIVTADAAVREATVWLCSEIGRSIDQPALAALRLSLQPGADFETAAARARATAIDRLADLPRLCRELSLGRHAVV
jgi:S-adenosylmethionine synthetase